MRPRDFGRVASTACDLLVVGGGIYGLAIATEAASRGLRTTLIEGSDFGGGAALNHQIVEGGLPAIRRGRIGRARAAIRDRRALARMAPWLLRPLPVIVGTYRSATRSRLALRVAFRLDRWIGRHRNAGVEPELHLPAARLISRAATLRLFPGVQQAGLTGAVQWYDYQILDTDRLMMAFAAAADRAGAAVANHVEALAAIRPEGNGGRVAGMRVRDTLTGDEAEIRAGVVINAAGENGGRILKAFGVDRPYPLVHAMTLVTSKRASDIALAAPARDGRMLMLVPWHGRAIVSTTGPSTLDAFISEVNVAFPALQLGRGDVTLVRQGVEPAPADGGGGNPLSAAQLLDHASDGVEGAVTVVGAHYGVVHDTARRAVALSARKLGRRLSRPHAEPAVLPGAGIADHEALAIETARAVDLELPLPVIRHLIGRYAEHSATIVRLMASEPSLQAPLDAGHLHLAAEVVFAIRYEMAVRLSDIAIRRLGLGATEHPGAGVLQAAASVAARELQWDDARVAEEIRDVEGFYQSGSKETTAARTPGTPT